MEIMNILEHARTHTHTHTRAHVRGQDFPWNAKTMILHFTDKSHITTLQNNCHFVL
jgi:hypothetical protein